MNSAQRRVLVNSLFAVAGITGFWIFVAVPLLILAEGGELMEMLENISHPLIGVPLLLGAGSLIAGFYVRAGAERDL